MGANGDLVSGRLAGIDFETIGLSRSGDRIAEVGIVLYDGPIRVDVWRAYVNTGDVRLAGVAAEVNGLSQADLDAAPAFRDEAEERLRVMTEDRLVIGHRLAFDAGMWAAECERMGVEPPARQGMDRAVAPERLPGATKNAGIGIHEACLGPTGRPHTALYDAAASLLLAKRMCSELGGMTAAAHAHRVWVTRRLRAVNPTSQAWEREIYAGVYASNGSPM